MDIEEKPLLEQFAENLPEGIAFKFCHISTPPTKCPAIFSAPPGARPEKTYCESHFLNVSLNPGDDKDGENLFAFAIEVLIYTTKHLTTLFVSKADSTGYLSLLQLPRSHGSPIKSVASTFISYLVKHRIRPSVRLVVSLFARAQDQYLYPGSIDNSTKHVLDDRGLVKWWCRVLDPVIRKYAPEQSSIDLEAPGPDNVDQTTAQGYVIVPGVDKYETTRFLPATVRSDPPPQKRWAYGHPLCELNTTPSAPPRCLVPHFPDDPKARFLSELDEEIHDGNTGSQITDSPASRSSGQWTSVKTLEQFWDMMAFRQECSSGRLVGFIWVVFTPPDTDMKNSSQRSSTPSSSSLPNSQESDITLPTPPSSQPSNAPTRTSSQPNLKKRKLTGPILPRPPRIKSLSVTPNLPERTPYYLWPQAGRGELLLPEKTYKRATDLLLKLDFSNMALAASSSRRWVEEVGVLAGRKEWGRGIVGRKLEKESSDTASAEEAVTTVLGVREKKKVDNIERKEGEDTEVNSLGAGLVRKKRKSEDEVLEKVEANGVNHLGAGLVRKKAKIDDPPPAENGVNVLGAGLLRKSAKVEMPS
ncbi:hypothetical protein M501DRAFT_1000768 [Patellaria atrata CBS 101060]|uniref:histone acetyltransferase n=1 Tax=Patellaria atrata CBS 101060 TaxID=1346257 RepID=A0A9P4SFT3_9PEZI|nr:hypothetical protein M501DRAFT_1000768 [Patellaria atrata CBS 101060]